MACFPARNARAVLDRIAVAIYRSALMRSSMHALTVAPVLALVVACSSEPGSASHPNDTGNSGAPAASGPTLTLTVAVEGTGLVRSEPEGIECASNNSGKCSADFPAGSHVKLVAAPAEGWKLDAWAGACSGQTACELDLVQGGSVSSKLALIDPRWDPSFGVGDCADAWGSAGEKLSPCDKEPDDYVVVRKGKRNIALCKSGKLVKNARIGLGFTPAGDKTKQGDGRTPEGVLYIPQTLPDSDYHRAFLLSYPRKEDAARGFNEGLISKDEHDKIIDAQSKCEVPLQDTNLGGAVEIHGEGSSKDWTAGCIGLENADIDVLWSVLKVSDTIVVLP